MPLEHIFGNIVGDTRSNIYFEKTELGKEKKTWTLMAGQIPNIQLHKTEVEQALPLIIKTLEVGGSAEAWNQFMLIRNQHDKFDFSEPALNSLGYSLLQNKKPVEALTVFRMMVELFPKSANALDSLADGLLANEMKSDAIETYRAILKIAPYHSNAKYMLQQLENKE